MRATPLLLLAAAAALVASACVLPLATGDQNCVSYCQLLQGCASPSAPSAECNAWCSAFTTQLEKEGCQAAFDAATTCVVGEGTCEAASCATQVGDAVACQQTYCASNPTESECQ